MQEKLRNFPWRNGEDVGLVYQGSAVRAPPQEIFHSNRGIAVLQKAWNSALDYSKNIIIIIIRIQKDSDPIAFSKRVFMFSQLFPRNESRLSTWYILLAP